MELSKKMKKFWAVLCVVAMVVTSVTVYHAKAAENVNAEATAEEWIALAGDAPDTYFYDNSTMQLQEMVNIQQPGWANAKGVYMSVSSGISEVTVNGVSEGVAQIQGAGVLIYLTALTKNINEVNITHAEGTGYVKIKNASVNVTSATTPQAPKAIEEKWIDVDITDKTYTGAEIKPSITIEDDNTILRPTIDYTVTYLNNINVGSAKIVIEGCGSYKGKIEKSFNIVARPLDKAKVAVSAPSYTGEAITEDDIKEIEVDKINFASSNFNISIAKETEGKINAGEKVKITLKPKDGNFTGEKETEFKIARRNIDDSAVTAGTISDQAYTGTALTPEVTLKHGDKVLVKDTDYKILSYTNNINAGTTAQVMIEGAGNYTGTKTLTFIINSQALDVSKINIDSQIYTGEPILPKEIIYDKNDKKTTITDADFTVELVKKDESEQIDNTNVGKVKVKIIGKRNYDFTKETEFEIVPKSVKDLEVSEIGAMEYTGAEIKPVVSIKYGKLSLENDKDYTLKYENNKKVGEATVVITGKGNYKDEKKVTFKIQKTIKLTVKEGKKTSVYTLGIEPSYNLPTNNKELAKQFPKLVKKGRVFKGFYKNGKKITKISDSTEVTLNARNYRNLKTSVKQMILNKGIISFRFNKKDWKQLDGVEITWAKNSKFKGKSKKKKTILTKGKKIRKLKYVIKKSERYFRNGEYYCFRIRYFYKVKNKKYYYQRESRKSIVYGKRLVVRK